MAGLNHEELNHVRPLIRGYYVTRLGVLQSLGGARQSVGGARQRRDAQHFLRLRRHPAQCKYK